MAKNEASLDNLYPPFKEQIKNFIKECKENNISIYVFCAERTFKEQEMLYAIGRIVQKDKSKVTNAQAGFSWHNYNVAIDTAFDGNPIKSGIQWTWDDLDLNKDGKQPIPWKLIGEIAEKHGLEWAGRWKSFSELCHFQNKFGLEIHQAKSLYDEGGLENVWDAMDNYRNSLIPKPLIIKEKEIFVIEDIKKESMIKRIINFIKKIGKNK